MRARTKAALGSGSVSGRKFDIRRYTTMIEPAHACSMIRLINNLVRVDRGLLDYFSQWLASHNSFRGEMTSTLK